MQIYRGARADIRDGCEHATNTLYLIEDNPEERE